jgi:hypothetical protein
MSIHAIKQYQAEVEKIIHFGGTNKEGAISHSFGILLLGCYIFIGMKLTIKITNQQAYKILHAIPKGSTISILVRDADKILDTHKPNKKLRT